MKRLLFFGLLFVLSVTACMPPPLELVPLETLAAQTLAAIPKTNTPLPPPTDLPTATPTPPEGPPTPTLDLSIPGAYCLPPDGKRTHGLVTKALGGDAIEVLITNQTYRVRYIGVDSPNIDAPAEWQSGQAMSFNQDLVEGKSVLLIQEATDQDANGWYPRYVLINQVFVNYEMIRQGFGKMASSPPDVICDNSLLAAQVEAQSNIRGIWQSTPAPTYTITPTPTITLTPTLTRFPTRTREGVCNCLGRRLTCNSFPSQARAQQCFEFCRSEGFGDIFGLDKNGNGLACEGSLNFNSLFP